MNMPTPTSGFIAQPRSAGPQSVCPGSPRGYDPVHAAWIDLNRADDLDPDGDDPLRGADDALARRGLTLRCWGPDDLDAFRALLDDPSVWAHLPEPYPAPLDRDAAAGLLALAEGLETHLVRAVVRNGLPVGQARLDLSPGGGTAELSYWLGQEFWGRGMGTAIVAGMVARAFGRMPAILRLVAKVQTANPASARVLENAGFVICAPPLPGFDDWRWYAMRRQDACLRGISSDASP